MTNAQQTMTNAQQTMTNTPVEDSTFFGTFIAPASLLTNGEEKPASPATNPPSNLTFPSASRTHNSDLASDQIVADSAPINSTHCQFQPQSIEFVEIDLKKKPCIDFVVKPSSIKTSNSNQFIQLTDSDQTNLSQTERYCFAHSTSTICTSAPTSFSAQSSTFSENSSISSARKSVRLPIRGIPCSLSPQSLRKQFSITPQSHDGERFHFSSSLSSFSTSSPSSPSSPNSPTLPKCESLNAPH